MICQYCKKKAVFVTGEKVYPNINELAQKRFWLCENCKAYVGVNAVTGKPLGSLANAELRVLRIKAHRVFDPIWKDGRMTRSEAYTWLAKQLDVEKRKCHIGLFNPLQCRQVFEIMETMK